MITSPKTHAHGAVIPKLLHLQTETKHAETNRTSTDYTLTKQYRVPHTHATPLPVRSDRQQKQNDAGQVYLPYSVARHA